MSIPRRQFLSGVGGLAAALAIGACSDDDPRDGAEQTATRPAARDERPNILLITADDMRADELEYMERAGRLLVEAGTTFTSCRVNVASCSPSRAGLLTGVYSDRHGVEDASRGLNDYRPTLGPWLTAAGYRTAVIGKFFTNLHARERRPGWTTWLSLVEDSQKAYGYGVNDGRKILHPPEHQAEWIRQATNRFIEDDDPRPWFAWVNPTDPHYPYEPLPGTEDLFEDVDWPVDPNPSLDGKPSWVRQRPPLTPEQVDRTKHMARQRLRELQGDDLLVEAALEAIDRSGRAGNTVVMFTSDNGNAVGERRIPFATAKNQPYDECLRVPLLARGPGFDRGATNATACNLQDVAATVVALAQAEPTVELDGTSLADLGSDPERAILHYRHGIGEADVAVPNGPAGDGMTTSTRKLWRYRTDQPEDVYELYDLDADPGELTNLAYEPSRRAERDELEARLDALLER